MSERLDFYFSFRSPYSYLAAPRAFALGERYAIDVRYRGVIPMAERGQAVPRSKALHTLRDVDREARRLGMPFGRVHDPLGSGARRCLLVAEHARDAGREEDFVLSASRGIWAEAVDVAGDRGLQLVSERAGLDWDACLGSLGNPELEARIDASTRALSALGHWGVPVIVFRGELFWGQDRLEDVERALGRAGLARA